MKLFEIVGAFSELANMADDPDMDPVLFSDTMESIEADLEEKADAYATIITKLNASVDMISREIERLNKIKKTLDDRVDVLKRNLEKAMTFMNKKKFKTDFHSYSIQKNAPSLVIVDESKIPDAYIIQQEPKLDRKALLADVKEDPEKFKGIAETKQTESLRIR